MCLLCTGSLTTTTPPTFYKILMREVLYWHASPYNNLCNLLAVQNEIVVQMLLNEISIEVKEKIGNGIFFLNN